MPSTTTDYWRIDRARAFDFVADLSQITVDGITTSLVEDPLGFHVRAERHWRDVIGRHDDVEIERVDPAFVAAPGICAFDLPNLLHAAARAVVRLRARR